MLILGGGPNRIGQGIEFDYCCCHASFSLRCEQPSCRVPAKAMSPAQHTCCGLQGKLHVALHLQQLRAAVGAAITGMLGLADVF